MIARIKQTAVSDDAVYQYLSCLNDRGNHSTVIC